MKLPGLLLAVSLVAGCGGGGGGSGGPGPTGPTGPTTPSGPSGGASSANVSLIGQDDPLYAERIYSFSPPGVTIVRNGTVTWTNTSGAAHNVTFAAAAGAPANIPEHVSGSFTRTFSTAGTFSYSCTLHSGMNGQVTVQ